jgi:hypothetical protein
MLLLVRLLFAAAASAAAAAAAASSFIIAATLLLQPHLFSATLFVTVELTHWLAETHVLHSDWFRLP